ncbi:MAG: YfiR family protein [Spirochaetes bacterium]|nr:YfiR family protein [Spirochaetota bacterium]
MRERYTGNKGKPPAMKRPLARAFIAASLCAASVLAVPPLFSEIPEQRVKAAFIEKFTHFIEWPEGSLGRQGQFVIGVIGYSQVTPHLLDIVSGRRLRDRDLVLKSVGNGPALSECQVLFIAPGEGPNLAAILARVRHRPVLTVADTPGFAERGVMINLFRSGSYVRFEINMDEVKRSPLKFSSKLLVLSKNVSQAGTK